MPPAWLTPMPAIPSSNRAASLVAPFFTKKNPGVATFLPSAETLHLKINFSYSLYFSPLYFFSISHIDTRFQSGSSNTSPTP